MAIEHKIEERWLFSGFKVYARAYFSEPWKLVAIFRFKADADRYVMNLNGAERGWTETE